MTLENSFKNTPYEFSKSDKNKFLCSELNTLMKYHEENCAPYSKILKAYNLVNKNYKNLEDFPYIPVRLFKDFTLKSCNDEDVLKTLTSSGTSSQKVSKIYIDKETSAYQTKALVNIMQSYIGKKRLPMLIIDSKKILKNRKMFSARGAGILGLSNFGRKHTYVLDDEMNIDYTLLRDFLETYKNQKILVFGFTFMIWQYFYEKLKQNNIVLDLSNAILIHSGGWKKLIESAVNNKTFKDNLQKQIGVTDIHDFYGMVEQVGSIFVECEHGYLHTPQFADVIIRDTLTLKALPFKKEGIIQVLSILPKSYPGHNLLTEDVGTIWGEDDCPCGRKGKYFTIKGRLAKAELRGCSDTHAYEEKR